MYSDKREEMIIDATQKMHKIVEDHEEYSKQQNACLNQEQSPHQKKW